LGTACLGGVVHGPGMLGAVAVSLPARRYRATRWAARVIQRAAHRVSRAAAADAVTRYAAAASAPEIDAVARGPRRREELLTHPLADDDDTAPTRKPRRTGMDTATRLDLYRTMVLIRTYEEAILREYHADKKPVFDIGAGAIPGEMHLSAGQEPVAAGVCAHLT